MRKEARWLEDIWIGLVFASLVQMNRVHASIKSCGLAVHMRVERDKPQPLGLRRPLESFRAKGP